MTHTNRFMCSDPGQAHIQEDIKAYIVLALYHGTIDAAPFEFRKFYTRGCPNNMCTHVSRAVLKIHRPDFFR